MAQKDRCAYCGEALSPQDPSCPHCGAENPGFRQESALPTTGSGKKPKTIDELKAYCASRGMPLERMRFFIGEDYQEPKAFGIYRDGPVFVVYKNKADGSRAIRYRGPDEAHAVGELYDKLMAEHEKRSNLRMTRYPTSASARSSSGGNGGSRILGGILAFLWQIKFNILILVVFLLISFIAGRAKHRNDGYYRVGDELFYRYGSSWFMDSIEDSWYEVADFPYEDSKEYFAGKSYETSWGGSSFTDSDVWADIQDSSSDSDGDWDYSGWDSSDTDWDSDW